MILLQAICLNAVFLFYPHPIDQTTKCKASTSKPTDELIIAKTTTKQSSESIEHTILDDLEATVRSALWGKSSEKQTARRKLFHAKFSVEKMQRIERSIRNGRKYPKPKQLQLVLPVELGDGKTLNVHLNLPANYNPKKSYPLMVAMGGGPVPNIRMAKQQAGMMLRLWKNSTVDSGWIVASIEDSISLATGQSPLRYHILTSEYFRKILDALIARYSIDQNRIHATGISLGSNYSIAYAAAHPDWFAGVFPVSTEGESREFVIRNLRTVSVAILEGAKDRNIRTIQGPRRLAEMMKQFQYRVQYREFANRGHEGFTGKYREVLKWLSQKPRNPFPKEVIRLPHSGILLPDRRFFWLEADTQQAAFHARVLGNKIEVEAAHARKLTFYLSDRLLNLDRAVTIRVNGKQVLHRKLARSVQVAIEDAAHLNDTERFSTVRITVDVPNLNVGEKWRKSLSPQKPPGRLAYWEMFAMQTLKQERPSISAKITIEGEQSKTTQPLAMGKVIEVSTDSPLKKGDRILEFDGEPFFFNAHSLEFLNSYLMRTPKTEVRFRIIRNGTETTVKFPLKKTE